MKGYTWLGSCGDGPRTDVAREGRGGAPMERRIAGRSIERKAAAAARMLLPLGERRRGQDISSLLCVFATAV